MSTKVCQIPTKVDRPWPAQESPNSIKSGRSRANFGRVWPMSGNTWSTPGQTLSNAGQTWSIPGQVWSKAEFVPSLVENGPDRGRSRAKSCRPRTEVGRSWSSRPKFSRNRPTCGRPQAKSAEIGRMCTLARSRPNLAELGPGAANFDTRSGQCWAISTGVGPLWAKIGLRSKNLRSPRS